jgi:hypothetical protein
VQLVPFPLVLETFDCEVSAAASQVKINIKVKVNIKGGGQERPHYTG